MSATRHLPPQLRSRPLGPIGEAHAGVERRLIAVEASGWLHANDPHRAQERRAQPITRPTPPTPPRRPA